MKARIVAESFEAGARVTDVARRHGVAAQQVTAWRRDARKGRLVLPVEDATPFAALVMEEQPTAAPTSAPSLGAIEIDAGGVMVRLSGDTPAIRVAETRHRRCRATHNARVEMMIVARRFRCVEAACARRIFAERLDPMAAQPRGRRTCRLV